MKNFKQRILSFFTAAVIAFTGLGILPDLSADASAADDARIIVSLGDSYSAGEGIEPFFGQDKASADKVKDQDWLAHRSENAWSGMLKLDGVKGTMKDNRGTNWFFVAASGAETKHIKNKFKKSYDYDGEEGSLNLDPQIKIFDSIPAGTVDYVTITIGGNDIGFVDIMTAAAMKPSSLEKTIEKGWKKYDSSVRSKIKKVYKAVAKAAGPQATIIVAGYPRIMNSEGFTVEDVPFVGKITVSAETAAKVNEASDKLNEKIADLVDECKSEGMNICFVPVSKAFSGHEAYTKDTYINGIFTKAQPQDIDSGSILSGYSLHPNKKGAKAYAFVVQKKINELEKSRGNASGITVKASSKNGKVTLKWDAVSGASKYRVYEYVNGKAKLIKTVTKTSFGTSDVKTGKQYKYSVTAYVNGKWTAIDDNSAVSVKVK